MKKRIELRRTTLRPLAPAQLARVGGGRYETVATCHLAPYDTDACQGDETIVAKTYRC